MKLTMELNIRTYLRLIQCIKNGVFVESREARSIQSTLLAQADRPVGSHCGPIYTMMRQMFGNE